MSVENFERASPSHYVIKPLRPVVALMGLLLVLVYVVGSRNPELPPVIWQQLVLVLHVLVLPSQVRRACFWRQVFPTHHLVPRLVFVVIWCTLLIAEPRWFG